MTREQLKDAVVEAARKPPIPSKYHGRQGFDVEGFLEDYDAWLSRRAEALAALDAHTEAEEVVTLAVWEHADGDLRLARIGTAADNWAAWTRLGTVTLPITQEGGR